MLRKKSKVSLVRLPLDRQIARLKIGMTGEVVATHPGIDNQILVKWQGKSGHVSHDPEDLKEIS